jgi:Uncharacterized protein conserved in bacteria (DUF2252)
MMQAASDIVLGWTRGQMDRNRHYYRRQLRDIKASAEVDSMAPFALSFYVRTCGWTLARAHARSGDPIAIAEYLGEDDQFDRSIADFSARYADRNERDDEAFAAAIRSGRLEAREGTCHLASSRRCAARSDATTAAGWPVGRWQAAR